MSEFERLQTKEFLRQIRGLAIITKNMQSACSLADMIARSGLDETLSQLHIEVKTNQGGDFQSVVRAGDYTGMNYESLGLGVSLRRPFAVRQQEGFVAVSLYTHMMDNYGRGTPIGVGIRGISKPDNRLGYQLFIDMFPNLKFKAVVNNLTLEDIREYAKQNTVPHPAINFSA